MRNQDRWTSALGADQTRPVRALGYLTVDRDRVDDPQVEQYAEQISRVCARRGWSLLEVVREIESDDRGLGRPALEYTLRRLEAGDASRLVVPRLERLCHSMTELGVILGQLQERHAHLLCVEPEIDTASEAGRTVIDVLLAVSGSERQRLAERTRKGLMSARRKRSRSRPAVEDRPKLKEQILAMREKGMTLQQIADTLNEEGVPTLRGGSRWRPSSLHAAIGYKRGHGPGPAQAGAGGIHFDHPQGPESRAGGTARADADD